MKKLLQSVCVNVLKKNHKINETFLFFCFKRDNMDHISSRHGTIKRKWGSHHTNLIGLSKVNEEFALIMTVYNMKRCMNILGIEDLLKKIKKWVPNYKGITFAFLKTRPLERLQDIPFLHMKLAA